MVKLSGMKKRAVIIMLSNYINIVVRDGFKFLWRNKGVAFASVITLAVALTITGFTLVFVNSGNQIVTHLQEQVEINAYVKEDVSRIDALNLAKEIEKMPGFAKLDFVSKEKGILLLQERFGTEMDLNSTLGGDNPLPDQYIIKATSPDMVEVIVKELKRIEEIDNIVYGKEIVDNILSFTFWAKNLGMFLISGVMLAALFLIMITIRLTVYSRAHEIRVMKFIGATNWYIILPFLIEGLIIGLLGSIIAATIIFFGYQNLMEYVIVNISFIPLEYDYQKLYYTLAGLIGGGILIGAVGSLTATRKHLKV